MSHRTQSIRSPNDLMRKPQPQPPNYNSQMIHGSLRPVRLMRVTETQHRAVIPSLEVPSHVGNQSLSFGREETGNRGPFQRPVYDVAWRVVCRILILPFTPVGFGLDSLRTIERQNRLSDWPGGPTHWLICQTSQLTSVAFPGNHRLCGGIAKRGARTAKTFFDGHFWPPIDRLELITRCF